MLKRNNASEHPFALEVYCSTMLFWSPVKFTVGLCGQSWPVAGWHWATSTYCSRCSAATAGGARANPTAPITMVVRTVGAQRVNLRCSRATPGRGIVSSTLGRARSQKNQVFPYGSRGRRAPEPARRMSDGNGCACRTGDRRRSSHAQVRRSTRQLRLMFLAYQLILTWPCHGTHDRRPALNTSDELLRENDALDCFCHEP